MKSLTNTMIHWTIHLEISYNYDDPLDDSFRNLLPFFPLAVGGVEAAWEVSVEAPEAQNYISKTGCFFFLKTFKPKVGK